jgi:hypothetical protein
MILKQDRNGMATHWLLRQRAAALRDEVPFLEANGLFVKPGISNDGRRNLGIVSLNDPNAILREILIPDVKGITVNYRLDHWRIQET